MKALTYVEIDIDYCSHTYGEAPCAAELGVTGSIKCFNTQRTCQDTSNFNNEPVTLRFAIPTDYLPRDIDCIPNIEGVSVTPATLSLGKDLGQRASVSVSFSDHRHSDTGPGFDKYLGDRDYDPYKQGTFWGKFRARQPYLFGRRLRLIQGFLGQPLEEMTTRHYIIDSFDGPTADGTYTLIAKDYLKLLDSDKAQSPGVSNGQLTADISASATSCTLSPSGIGDAEYPSSGFVCIGGKEVCWATRSGDTLTLTRGQAGTTAREHKAEDRVQIVLNWESAHPAELLYDLMVEGVGIPEEFVAYDEWVEEIDTYVGVLFTGMVAEPTSSRKLVCEIIEQAGLIVWWDEVRQLIRLRVLRSVPVDAKVIDSDVILRGTLKTREQPQLRLSQVWTHYGKRDPTEGDNANNYRSCLATVEAEYQGFYGAPAIRKIYARWIPPFGRVSAARLNDLVLSRFRDPPRRFNFELPRQPNTLFGNEPVQLASGYLLRDHSLQDATGAAASVPIQVTRIEPLADRLRIEAEEMSYIYRDPTDLLNRVIWIDSNAQNVNLRTSHDLMYPDPTEEDIANGLNVTVVIASGVTVGSLWADNFALRIGNWPSSMPPIVIENRGAIRGCGGKGGESRDPGWNSDPSVVAEAGQDGGGAIHTRRPIIIRNYWDISGGGGGGGAGLIQSGSNYVGGGAGGGGGGVLPGQGGHAAPGMGRAIGANGHSHWGGNGGNYGSPMSGGKGGDPGQDGEPGFLNGWWGAGRPGGAAGAAIDGISWCTIEVGGTRRGPEIN